jgi:prepilin-type N-terminal cleavage/methylation domain-containing protein
MKGIRLGSEAGFTLVETLVATIIFALMVLAFGATYMNGRLLVVNEGAKRQALMLAQSGLEELKLTDFVALEDAVDKPVKTNISIADANFLRTVEVTYVDEVDYTVEVAGPTDSLKLTVTVSDNDAEPDFPEVVLETVVANVG